MAWNHRVIASKYKDEVYFSIYEVHYSKEGVPEGMGKDPVVLNFLDIKGLRWTLNKMKLALKKPILMDWDFPNEYKENGKNN